MINLDQLINDPKFSELLYNEKEMKLHNKLFNSDRKEEKMTLADSLSILGYKKEA